MFPDSLGAIIVAAALDEINKVISAAEVDAEGLAYALQSGTVTDDQMAEFTRLAHFRFDQNLGCMADTIVEMNEVGVPHYAINHAIRTYVRVCDKRETEAAEQHSEKMAERNPREDIGKRTPWNGNYPGGAP